MTNIELKISIPYVPLKGVFYGMHIYICLHSNTHSLNIVIYKISLYKHTFL